MDDQTRQAEFDDAFAGLYLEARRVTGWILGDRPTAEDAAAEALVRSLTRWHRVRAMPHRDAWVLRAASTVALERAPRSAGPAVTSGGGRDTEGALDRTIVDALGQLPRRQRDAIVLTRLVGCAPGDVAAVLEVPEATVDRCVRRGLAQLDGPLPRVPAAARPRGGRPIDEMRAVVHREAARRARRSSVVLGTGAVGAALLVLVALLLSMRAEPGAELATAGTTGAATGRPTDPPTTSLVSPRSDDPSPDAVLAPRSPGTEVADEPGPATTTSRPAGSPRTPATRPAGRAVPPGPDAGRGPRTGPGAPPDPTGDDGATPIPTAPGPPGPTGPTGPTGPASPTTAAPTPAGPFPCTAEDFGATDIAWGSVRSGRPYPRDVAPSDEVTWFALSVWANEGAPCVTADWRQDLTITDASGAVVYRRLLDDGAGRLVEPGRWVLFDGWITWDPACEEATPEPWITTVCTPVGAGSYSAQIVVAGATPPPLTVTILDG